MDNILICILLTASLIKLSENCLPDWFRDEKSGDCYMLVESPANWTEANQQCAKLHKDATLSKVPNFKDILDSLLNGKPDKLYWLGAQYSGSEWLYIDNTSLFAGNFDCIKSKQQYDNTEKPRTGKKCLLIGNSDRRLFRASCDSKFPFICSMKDSITYTMTDTSSSFPESHATDIILPCVVVPLFILLIVGIAVVVFRRKRQIATRPVGLNKYEDLHDRVPSNEHNYSNLHVNENSDYESQTPHPDVNTRIYSVMDHDYSSAYFPSYIELSETNDAYPLYNM